MSALLRVEGITRNFRRASRPALDSVSFEVEAGQLLTLVGASGSGKTSLLRILAGLDTPDAGQITLRGERLNSGTTVLVPAERRHMGFVFQNHALFPHLTVRDNVAFGLGRQDRASKVVEQLLELVGLGRLGARYPHELSGGERQRIALVRALAPEPSLLLMDEPFSSLDQALRLELRDETRRLVKQRGATTIMVTHETGDALAVSDRIVVLREGAVQQVGTPQEIYRRPANRYIASSFGPCNFLSREVFGHAAPVNAGYGIQPSSLEPDELWVRPEDLALAPVGQASPLGSGVVRQSLYHGDSSMVTVQCRTAQGGEFTLLVRQHGDARVEIGDLRDVVPAGPGGR